LWNSMFTKNPQISFTSLDPWNLSWVVLSLPLYIIRWILQLVSNGIFWGFLCQKVVSVYFLWIWKILILEVFHVNLVFDLWIASFGDISLVSVSFSYDLNLVFNHDLLKNFFKNPMYTTPMFWVMNMSYFSCHWHVLSLGLTYWRFSFTLGLPIVPFRCLPWI
jgi:hypothetical protein